jgi:hypothetical protein
MKKSIIILVAAVLMVFLAVGGGLAFRAPDIPPAPDFDIRSPYYNAIPDKDVKWAKTPAQQATLNSMGHLRGGFSVKWSALTRAPSRIYDLEAPITGPRKGPKKDIANGFLNENISLFGLQPDDTSETRTSRENVTRHNGVTHVTIQQQVNGLDVFQATFMANIDRDGRVLNLSSSLMPKIRKSVNTLTPQITPDEAIAKAAQSAMVILVQNARVEGLVYFPLAIGKTRLAYEVIIEDGQTPNIYRTLVDAVDGTVLWRKNLVAYDSPYAHGMVFMGDSPNPNTPIGSSTGEMPRTDTDFDGLGFFPLADPHADWWNGSGEADRTRTISNNVQVRDPSDNFAIAPTDAYFNLPLPFPIDITADPATYTGASIVNTFYRLNRLHDQLYDWGFDEAAGNYQHDKFGGPAGDDRINCHVQVPSEGCNAHSGGPWINTGMCGANCWDSTQPWSCRDMGFETPIVAHEFGHSIHFNLIPTLGGAQYTGEGFADIVSITAFAEPGDDLFGSYPSGQWVLNNVNGVRRRPYSTDQTVFPYTYGTIKDNPGIYEVGEVWCNTVWMARANLVWKYGFQTGHPTMMKLVVDGMKLAPEEPDFLDLRDAILLSDRINNSGVNQCILWDAFAKMGLGWSAKSMGADDGAPLEAFDTPSTCTPNIRVNGSLDYGALCPNDAMAKQLEIFNTGTGDLIVKKVSRVAGSTDITIDANPTLPAFISDDANVNFTVRCAPTSVGTKTATIRIESNDADQPTIDLTATCEGATQTIVPVIADSGAFGDVCVGSYKDLNLTISNSGGCTLTITGITSDSGQFQVAGGVAFPLNISAGGNIQVPIRFQPSSSGSKSANITIVSNDPDTPSKVVHVTGNAPTSAISTAIANTGNFGDVCVGTFKDLPLTINNTGGCDLSVSNITSSTGEFIAPGASFPLIVSPGSSTSVTIRFQPSSLGPKSANMIITSNAPSSPTTVDVSGNVPPGDIRVTGSTDFGDVCADTQAEKKVSVCNVGKCNLNVTSVAFNPGCADFQLTNNPFPAIVSPDSCVDVVIRFTPTSAGPKSCTLVITSDDPDTPSTTLTVTANTPAASIDVSPDQAFLPTVIQSIGACQSLKPFPISNTGKCNLYITGLAITDNAAEYSLADKPSLPIILEPGHMAGEGDLMTVFEPTIIDRGRTGQLTVTYESDPITHDTTSVTRQLCGEGVMTGARVLVTVDGVPVDVVKKIQIQRLNGNRNKKIVDTVDVARDVPLMTETPGAACPPIQYHREYGTVSNPVQLLPGSYQVTVMAAVNGKNKSKTVSFDVDTCDFNPNIVIEF